MSAVSPLGLVVFVTVPSVDVAERLAQRVLEVRAAACVTVLPGVRSHYRWRGVLERSDEVQLVVKTTNDRFAALRDAVVDVHPNEVPELIAMPIVDGLPAYLSWLVDETRPSTTEAP